MAAPPPPPAGRPAPRVMLVQDMSGFGRCASSIALPILSAMGCQCCPLLTAWLSSHTGFPGSTVTDLTAAMPGVLAHWRELKLSFSAIYSGFLASPAQAELTCRCLRDFGGSGVLTLVDPVLGDNGRAYRTCTPELCREMARLARQAAVLTPNLTEAALLLGLSPARLPQSRRETEEWAFRLAGLGCGQVALTGVSPEPGLIGALCLADGGEPVWICGPAHPGSFHGTGDVFASVLLGGLLAGEGLAAAARRAVDFTGRAVRRTLALGTPPAYGLEFEGLLSLLTPKAQEDSPPAGGGKTE